MLSNSYTDVESFIDKYVEIFLECRAGHITSEWTDFFATGVLSALHYVAMPCCYIFDYLFTTINQIYP